MKITLYTITDCQFSKQEKEYLSSHTLVFEEKNLETNRDFLTEMLTLSNNFAGTPVTKIEKDDGQIVVLKGFTKEEFDKTLGFMTSVAPAPTPTSEMQTANPTTTDPATPPSVPTPNINIPVPAMPMSPVSPPVQEQTQPPVPQPAQQTAQPQTPVAPDPMNSVLNNLQNQAANPPPLPNIPDPKL